ncbi:hypothetical protein KAZ66_01165 [Candidatus Woesebacteria bacterium]|nr:hypothetical protein [Candidatus Woesebacteria bacterium]
MSEFCSILTTLKDQGVSIRDLTDEELGLITIALSMDWRLNTENYAWQAENRRKQTQAQADLDNIILTKTENYDFL